MRRSIRMMRISGENVKKYLRKRRRKENGK